MIPLILVPDINTFLDLNGNNYKQLGVFLKEKGEEKKPPLFFSEKENTTWYEFDHFLSCLENSDIHCLYIVSFGETPNYVSKYFEHLKSNHKLFYVSKIYKRLEILIDLYISKLKKNNSLENCFKLLSKNSSGLINPVAVNFKSLNYNFKLVHAENNIYYLCLDSKPGFLNGKLNIVPFYTGFSKDVLFTVVLDHFKFLEFCQSQKNSNKFEVYKKAFMYSIIANRIHHHKNLFECIKESKHHLKNVSKNNHLISESVNVEYITQSYRKLKNGFFEKGYLKEEWGDLDIDCLFGLIENILNFEIEQKDSNLSLDYTLQPNGSS